MRDCATKVRVLCKVRDSDLPEELVLDVGHDDWRFLTPVDTFLKQRR